MRLPLIASLIMDVRMRSPLIASLILGVQMRLPLIAFLIATERINPQVSKPPALIAR